jgi:hypothetical protein
MSAAVAFDIDANDLAGPEKVAAIAAEQYGFLGLCDYHTPGETDPVVGLLRHLATSAPSGERPEVHVILEEVERHEEGGECGEGSTLRRLRCKLRHCPGKAGACPVGTSNVKYHKGDVRVNPVRREIRERLHRTAAGGYREWLEYFVMPWHDAANTRDLRHRLRGLLGLEAATLQDCEDKVKRHTRYRCRTVRWPAGARCGCSKGCSCAAAALIAEFAAFLEQHCPEESILWVHRRAMDAYVLLLMERECASKSKKRPLFVLYAGGQHVRYVAAFLARRAHPSAPAECLRSLDMSSGPKKYAAGSDALRVDVAGRTPAAHGGPPGWRELVAFVAGREAK